MSRNKDKGRLQPFVPLIKETLSTPVWRAMSHGARSLYVSLKWRLSNDGRNNGRVFLSQRDAERELGCNRRSVGRWFRELQYYGFIEMTEPGCLGSAGKGKAPHWRLTEIGYRGEYPTKEFNKWNGIRFHDQPPRKKQKQNPVGSSANEVCRKVPTPALAVVPTPNGTSVGSSGAIYEAEGVGSSANISSIPLPSPSLTPLPTSKTCSAFGGRPKFPAKSADNLPMSADALCYGCDALVTPVTFPRVGI
jgi:hypothetical protein